MTHYELVASNKRKSWLIMALFVVFVVGIAYVFSQALDLGLGMVGWALIASGVMSFASYWWSDKLILGISGAKPANRKDFFDFYTVTENICIGQRLPKPKLYVIQDSAMNAFATGRDPEHAVVCATTGLLQRLDRSELEGVIAHELSHIRNYDMLLMSVVTVLVGLVALLADYFLRWGGLGGRRSSDDNREGGQLQAIFMILAIVLALLSPLIAQLIQLAISRRREFLADASAVEMTKNPRGLAQALAKLDQDREPLEVANKATAHLYITNPLKNLKGGIGTFASLFATHPPITERIKALQSIAG